MNACGDEQGAWTAFSKGGEFCLVKTHVLFQAGNIHAKTVR